MEPNILVAEKPKTSAFQILSQEPALEIITEIRYSNGGPNSREPDAVLCNFF